MSRSNKDGRKGGAHRPSPYDGAESSLAYDAGKPLAANGGWGCTRGVRSFFKRLAAKRRRKDAQLTMEFYNG